jgi:hypothetical protein
VCAAKTEQKVSSLTQRRLGASPRRRGWETRRRVHRKFRRVSMKKWPKGTACTGVEGAACGVAYIALAVSMNRQRSVHRWISARSFSVCRSELYNIDTRQPTTVAVQYVSVRLPAPFASSQVISARETHPNSSPRHHTGVPR